MAKTPFKLKSGNTPSFKTMGSSPNKHKGIFSRHPSKKDGHTEADHSDSEESTQTDYVHDKIKSEQQRIIDALKRRRDEKGEVVQGHVDVAGSDEIYDPEKHTEEYAKSVNYDATLENRKIVQHRDDEGRLIDLDNIISTLEENIK